MQPQRVVDYLVYVIVRLFICVVQAISLETGRQLAGGLAWLMADALRVRGKVVDENLRHALPGLSDRQRRRLARRMWEHLFLLVIEVAHAPRKIHETNWRQFVRLKDVRPLVAQLLTDRPIIIVTAHFGNFEAGGYLLGILGFPTFAIARTLDNRYLNRFVNRFRGVTGQYIVPKNGGYDQILDVLGQGGTLSLLADQYAGRKGCWVQFFHRPASAHKAIALLALEHQALVAVTYARRLEHPMRFEMCCAAMADPRDPGFSLGSIPALTQWYTSQMEDFIARWPEQYWWIHRRWKDTRKKKSTAKQAA
ncbi:MAG: lysophospholipid acyltransferase family protein [Pirellulales bacterium]|nr:lysophospholipid acyltransferase family protein [Pirellulales bacterium]